jgi:hypothetical protein
LNTVIPSGSLGVEMTDWHSCNIGGFIQVDDWPLPGSGAKLIWNECQSSEIGVAGYFTVDVHGPGTLEVVGYPYVNGERTVQPPDVVFCDLTPEFLPPGRAGWISMGGGAVAGDSDGCNPLLEPCLEAPVPAKRMSWGKLKVMYGEVPPDTSGAGN